MTPEEKEEVTISLTLHQADRLRRMGHKLWPEKDLSVGEIRAPLLKQLLWAEDEPALVVH